MGNFMATSINGLIQFTENQTNTIIASSWLPLISALIFTALGEGSLLILIIITALKLNNEYHQLTASSPTTFSRIFRGIVTVLLGITAWNHQLQEYFSVFLMLSSLVFIAWIFALSSLYPYTDMKSQNGKKQNSNVNPNISTISSMSHINNVGNITNISSVESSFNASFSGAMGSSVGSSAINDSFHYSPNRGRFQTQSRPLASNSNILNTSNVPFLEDHNQTLLCDDLPTENVNGSRNSRSGIYGVPGTSHNFVGSQSFVSSLNGSHALNPLASRSILDFNQLSSATASKEEISRIAKLAEPTNYFQSLVGFSSVYCTLNALNIFEERKRREIISGMNKSNYFHLSSLHFAAMMVDIFAFTLIPFFLFHILLVYQSQHSMIPIAYVLLILFVNQYGESMVTSQRQKHVITHSISDQYTLEGTLCSMLMSCITAVVIFWILGLTVFGPMCGPVRTALKLHPSLREQCVDAQCMFCEGSFVGMGWWDHLMMGILLAVQAFLGRVMVELVIRAYEFKLMVPTKGMMVENGQMVLWMRKCSPFILAFVVMYYYLL